MKTNTFQVPSIPLSDCSLQIRIATEPWEKREIYRLRYEVYVQEMAKPLGSTVNKEKLLYDSLDKSSILLYAQDGSNIVATIRLSIAAEEDYPSELVKAFCMDKFLALHTDMPNRHFGLGTKLAVKTQYRNSPALYLIITEAYRLLREHNVQICFTGCNPYLISLYERMGFRKFAGNFTDPGYGLLVALVMVVEDIEHFQAVKSPLYRHARKYNNNSAMARRFLQVFPEATTYLNSQLADKKGLWKYIQHKLHISPYDFPTFRGLDEENIMAILTAGVIFSCTPGDFVLHPNSLCNDLYIILSGTLVATSQIGSHLLRPGNHFGSFTRPNLIHQKESISALTEAEIFVLSLQAFARYQHLHPQAAEILLNNLTNTQNFAYACATLTEQGGKENE